jgi:hypothetical protein
MVSNFLLYCFHHNIPPSSFHQIHTEVINWLLLNTTSHLTVLSYSFDFIAKKYHAYLEMVFSTLSLNLNDSRKKHKMYFLSLSFILFYGSSTACEIVQTHSDSQIAWNEVYYIHIFSTSITKALPS